MGCGSSLASSPIRAVDGPRKPGSSNSVWPKRWAHLASDRKEIPPQDVALSYDQVPLRGNTNEDSEWNGESFDMPDVEAPEDNLEVLEDEGVKRTISSLSFGKMFVDQYFPPQDSSIYFNRRPVEGNIVWMRPHELVEKPELLVNGISRHDIVQGILGDCWFLSSCAAVAQRPDLMRRVIPSKQLLHGEMYKGAARFRLWRFGRWVTIYVDDLLPTRNGELIYSRSSDKREFWVALLEKAYAKLHGSYEALEGGQAMDALVDLTSGLAERYDLEEVPPHLFLFLLQASSHGAFITCSRKGDWRMATTADPNGLVSGHAYTVTGVANVTLNSGDEVNLVRVRNPWGNCIEWTGPWNDNDPIWNQVDGRTKRQLDWKQRGDGEFWMCFDDFRKEFEEVSICTLGPDFNGDGIAEQAGQVKAIRGHWIADKSCGGSRNNVELFATNPQYLLTIYSFGRCSSIGPIKAAMDRKCCVVISLMQVHRNAPRHLGVKMMQIGFVIYKTDNCDARLSKQCFYNNFDEGNSGPYINYREVFGRYEFYPGNYVIVPATFEPGYPGEFMIRVYSETAIDLKELK